MAMKPKTPALAPVPSAPTPSALVPLALITLAVSPLPAFAAGQSVPVDYDSLSFLEEPLAVPIGDSTLSANLLVDQGVRSTRSARSDDHSSRFNGQLVWGTQLSNGWQAELQYLASYNNLAIDEYDDTYILSIADDWGTLAAGNVTGSVRANTRRTGGTGNADLSNTDFSGGLDETGVYYAIRFNAYQLSMTADGDRGGEIGLDFEQPVGQKSYVWSARVRQSETATADTSGAALVGQLNYASITVGAELGYEHLGGKAGNRDENHRFGSVGLLTKTGAYTFSFEAGLSRQAGVDTRAAALGARFDVARGLSLNLGLNHVSTTASHENTVLASGRYEF